MVYWQDVRLAVLRTGFDSRQVHFLKNKMENKIKISLENKPIAEISKKFLSIAIDTAQIIGKDWWSPKAEIDWALIGSRSIKEPRLVK